MNEFIFGFSTGLSLILAIGAQNLFVIEQGIKKNTREDQLKFFLNNHQVLKI